MNSLQYNSLIDQSFNQQFKHAIDGKLTVIGDVNIIETGIDLGRATGKTTAIADKIIRDSQRGIYTYYVTQNKDAACRFAKEMLHGHPVHCMVLGKGQDIGNFCRGYSQPFQAVNIIFDECDLRSSERLEYVRMISYSMREVAHPFRYIHVIRMGM